MTLYFKDFYVSLPDKNNIMICFPNAKINIGLNIVSKREDGYHNIETIFYPIALSDALEVLPSRDRRAYRLFQTGIDIHSKPENNLVIKALNLLGADKDIPNLDIHLLKTIPFGAGLGGGSSNGASMLQLLNETFSLGYSDKELKQFAVKLGADCSFFLKNTPSFATGIGEELEEVELSLEDYFMVLVKPDIHISTQEAYNQIIPKESEVSVKEMIKLPMDQWQNVVRNDFEAPIFNEYPEIEEIKQTLYEKGAIYASMTGSGPSVFGFFKEKPTLSFPNCFVWRDYE